MWKEVDIMIKRFIVWYILHRCRGIFRYKGRVVRIFTEEFYDGEVREYLNYIKRAKMNNNNREDIYCPLGKM